MDGSTASNSRDSSHKVIAIAAGEAHTLALTGDGNVYAWGRGTFGRLGTGSEADEHFPVPIDFDFGRRSPQGKLLKFVEIAAGAYHSLALADDGSVWSWGYNIYGQLGVNGEHALVPCLLDRFLELGSPDSFTDESEANSRTPLKVSSVKAGGMMSLAIDNLGALWMWGNCPQQSSSSNGEFSLVRSSTPMPVWSFHGHTVVKVACGNEHVVALVSAGETYKGGDLVCYSWGGNNHGQLGLGDTESRLHPEIVEKFNQSSSWAVYAVACGAFHTALLAVDDRSGDTLRSVCWTFGLGENGQLGHGTTRSALLPEPVKGLPHNEFLIIVDCGLFHTSVVSLAGDVWSWGMEKGLGLCPDASFTGTDAGDAISPLLISCDGPSGPKFPGPVQVACGAAHTVLVADDGYKLWSWGRGRSGVLGNGKTFDCFAPTILLWPPQLEDFKEKKFDISTGVKKSKGPDLARATEMEKTLSAAMEEMKLLQSKLSVMEKYTSILHGSIFGKPFEERDMPTSLQNSGTFDIAKEWESMLESSDRAKLIRLEMFYRNMLAGIKDKILKKRIQEIVKECVGSSTRGNY
ncbi:Ultraviolet-B receptor like [Actinidia chinensis var. chinensis]|uniref:Ultraviolet-B receptor like n=1 Tax=Actinidia chinensis var. chinensis TaxID=1590841 RepID=A0A2R6PHA9_ACTCC|nr:Ultraviolet-B receptor like [Actinidia chinensis var. chinensis]